MAYVTGAHSFKVGYQAAYEVYRQVQNVDNQLAYTFNNGTPIQFTMRIGPHIQSNRTRYDGFYVQDQWTRGRLTLQGALRYEHAWSWFPEGENGITRRQPVRQPLHLPASRTASPASTTSRRAWARPTTCSGTARRR